MRQFRFVENRGNAINVKFPYFSDNGEYKTQWETYYSELEAMQRKATIDYLKKKKDYEGIRKAVQEYKEKKNAERVAKGHKINDNVPGMNIPKKGDNLHKTVKDFMHKWLPFHARKRSFSPNSVDSYDSNINEHILPYFGQRILNSITGEEWDEFFDYLSQKPCSGAKAHKKNPEEIPTLSPGTIIKVFNIAIAGLKTAKAWGYIEEIPNLTSPRDKSFSKRNFWSSDMLYNALAHMPCQMHEYTHLMHLAIHLAFIGSLRAGETTGINVKTVDMNKWLYCVEDEVQRVSKKALDILPKQVVKYIFPQQVKDSKTRLILKDLKTEKSLRIQYMTPPLRNEIARRLKQIEINKSFYGSSYHDYGLLLCHPNGDPLEPRILDRWFKKWQRKQDCLDFLDFQGIRKSAQMHKKRLRTPTTPALQAIGAHTPEVIQKHYDEFLEADKRKLIDAVEFDFYTREDYASEEEWQDRLSREEAFHWEIFKGNPEMYKRMKQKILSET